jgi:hypothetical protein
VGVYTPWLGLGFVVWCVWGFGCGVEDFGCERGERREERGGTASAGRSSRIHASSVRRYGSQDAKCFAVLHPPSSFTCEWSRV